MTLIATYQSPSFLPVRYPIPPGHKNTRGKLWTHSGSVVKFHSQTWEECCEEFPGSYPHRGNPGGGGAATSARSAPEVCVRRSPSCCRARATEPCACGSRGGAAGGGGGRRPLQSLTILILPEKVETLVWITVHLCPSDSEFVPQIPFLSLSYNDSQQVLPVCLKSCQGRTTGRS